MVQEKLSAVSASPVAQVEVSLLWVGKLPVQIWWDLWKDIEKTIHKLGGKGRRGGEVHKLIRNEDKLLDFAKVL